MSEIFDNAVKSVLEAETSLCRYITANDTGQTGSHQAGFYVPKCAASLLFERPGQKGENKEKTVRIEWQDDIVTESCMKYYGVGTRNEYRITRFGRNFPFLQDDFIGAMLVMSKYSETDYKAYVLTSDEDIDRFSAYFNLSPENTNQLIDSACAVADERIERLFGAAIRDFSDFPSTAVMSSLARSCYNESFMIRESDYTANPDRLLLSWIDAEYKLFKLIENKIYLGRLSQPFESVEDFVRIANEVLNRRKSRAGKSLEHHLSELFSKSGLRFEEQAMTEERKRPDFLFPSGACYHNIEFPAENLIVLGAKTTCKDRWRQVLTEADRVDRKYLFTLQQGISSSQLEEMASANLRLVVPRNYISSFPRRYQSQIADLGGFIRMVRENQAHLPRHYLM